MKGRIVLVTGADGGLGIHVTKAFVDVGATVVGTSRKIRQSALNGADFTAVPGDISTLEGAEAVVNQVLTRFGNLDVLAHTVGAFAGGRSVAETEDSTFQSMFNANFGSVLNMVRATIPALRKAKDGRIIAVGSRTALDPVPCIGAYSASKAAMVSLIKTVALENKDAGLTANVILPSTIDTPENRKEMPNADFSKWVQPANIASLIVFLAGDAAKDINGATIPIYGNA